MPLTKKGLKYHSLKCSFGQGENLKSKKKYGSTFIITIAIFTSCAFVDCLMGFAVERSGLMESGKKLPQEMVYCSACGE